MTAEQQRLAETLAQESDWQRWGTYLSERAWGTVREDYSADGSAWDYFPHDHARSRAYRWNEDGIGGFCDDQQHLCLAVTLWNERDPILKERMFGLANAEGNHGEDVKEYYFYLDNTPTHSYARMLYKYPQVAFPYADLVAENTRRTVFEPEYELFDALEDAFRQQRYFDVVIEYAKADAEDILCRITAINRGPDPAPIHILPHLWYRNTWSWDHGAVQPALTALSGQLDATAYTEHPSLGERWWYIRCADGRKPALLFTDNHTNLSRLFGTPNPSPYVKDGINDAVVNGYMERVNSISGSKVAAHAHALVAPGETFTVQVRFSPCPLAGPFADFDDIFARRLMQADAFYATIHAPRLNAEERMVQRQAFAGLLWSKQFYHLDVYRWLHGDPTQPAPPPARKQGRNHDWGHLYHADILLMPDPWEYPWYASWDLAFHCLVMAMIDPAFAKQQLRLLTMPQCQHPYGTVPAYEWDFNAVNPPLIAWAVWQVYQLDRAQRGEGDLAFLEAVFDGLMMMLSWWLNRKDSEGRGIFGGGFLGLDNVGLFDRGQPLPTGETLEQSDATGWMAMFQLHMLEIALELARYHPDRLPMAIRFAQVFLPVVNALQNTGAGGQGLWDSEEGFYFDAIRLEDGQRIPLKVFSIVGLIPLCGGIVIENRIFERLPALRHFADEAMERLPFVKETLLSWEETGTGQSKLLSVVYGDRLRLILQRLLDEAHFLSEYGVRSLSRIHLDSPYRLAVGDTEYRINYLPGYSDNTLFGGNSNWRGPIWFPINFLLIQALNTFARFYGDEFTVECPVGSGRLLTLAEVGEELARRLIHIFLRDEGRDGRRAVLGDNDYFQQDPHWRNCIPFHEFFHGDNGCGLGASHQTGWTALIAVLLQYGGALHFDRLDKFGMCDPTPFGRERHAEFAIREVFSERSI